MSRLSGSRCILFSVLILLLCKLAAWFFTPDVDLASVDSNQDVKLRINFNITMPALSCENASVDVLDVYGGTNELTVAEDIERWPTDENGVKREFYSRDKTPPTEHQDLDLARKDQEHAVPLTSATFEEFVQNNENTMVYFYARWSHWSMQLAATWEAFAQDVEHTLGGKMRVAKVDCAVERDFCSTQNLMEYPTIRFLKSGVADEAGDYKKDRTVPSLVQYATVKIGAAGKTPKTSGHLELGGFKTPRDTQVEHEDREHTVQLTTATFDEFVESNDNVMVHFYTSWWDECLRYSRGCYQQLADHDRRQGRAAWYAFAEEVEYTFDGSMKVAKVDCVEEQHLCEAQNLGDINASPVIRFFKSGVADEVDYTGELDVASLVRYAAAKIGRAEEALSRCEGWEHIVQLTSATFEEFVENNDNVMVLFYIPYTVWSTRLKPTWEAFAEDVERYFDGTMGVAKVDCAAERDLCESKNLGEVTTIRYFRSGLVEDAFRNEFYYKDSNRSAALLRFATARVEENERIVRSGRAVPLTLRNFEDFIEHNDNVMVYFHTIRSGHRNQLEPRWETFADVMRRRKFGGKMKVAKVQCAAERELCEKQQVREFPTFRSFKSGVAADYHNGYSLSDFVEYATAMVGGDDGNAGCQLSGSIVVNRMLGSFHIRARSDVPDIDRAATNVSHVVNSLEFEMQLPAMGQLGWVDTGGALEDLSALGDRTHNIQVVMVPMIAGDTGAAETSENHQYQMVVSSNNSTPLDLKKEPAVHFFYDCRAMSVYMTQRPPRKWFDVWVSVLSWQSLALNWLFL